MLQTNMASAKKTTRADASAKKSPHKKSVSKLGANKTAAQKFDPETSKYAFQYAPTGQARCRGLCVKHNPPSKIRKGQIRLAIATQVKGNATYHYKCW
jgi:hypothetical protein